MAENLILFLKELGVIEGGPMGSYRGQEGIGYQVYASYSTGLTGTPYPYESPCLDRGWFMTGCNDREKAEEFLRNFSA